MPSADFYGVVREDCSALSPDQDTPQSSRGQPSYLLCLSARLIKHSQVWLEDVAVPCPLVPTVPPLLSGSCSSPRTFAPRVLPTPPRGDALALHWSFGSAHTWHEDLHLARAVPGLAHTTWRFSGGAQRRPLQARVETVEKPGITRNMDP
jgi:hypothetical protein